jgi:outer membrane protein insertion porin family
LLGVLLGPAPRARAQSAPNFAAPAAADSSASDSGQTEAPLRVGHVRVDGTLSSDTLRVLRTFELFPGQLYSDEAVRRGIRKLFALGVFEDISTDRDEHDGVMDIIIHVTERPRIGRFSFVGNHHKSLDELQKKLFVRVGEAYSPNAIHTQVDSLVQFYHDDGYSQASIEASADSAMTDHRVMVRFKIQEGEKVKITKIEVIGLSAVHQAMLQKAMKSKPKGFFGGGDVKEENFEEDRQKIEAYLHNHGYRDGRVISHELKPGDTPRHLTYVLTVEEGRRYVFGKVNWSGAQVVAQSDLAQIWKARPGDVFDASAVEKAQGEAYAMYAERGYLYLNVEPRQTARDSVVDISFVVSEGQPSTVRLVNIVGNHGTREKVIRRQLSIHEGDRFRRSALVRTQGDVFRLGIFNDVQMDFTPAESTDVDINVKVTEKQVGTASAGAGYTSEAGLTGFLELGHNNVLGNQQSLSLHLERGGHTSNYFLSFTEPWFHDTPTLLGFSAFNSSIVRDFYREKRVGASGQIGRPLRVPDFSHVAFSYRLESVTYDSLTTVLATSVQDSITLEDINPGVSRLTSNFTFSFTRNNTNNPFYPTRGTKLSLVDEFTGGPFGGTISFHKHRIDGRVYLPSIMRGITTMVRARVGLMGEYANENLGHVPAYEKFRLGGGSTVDPLRGYDDYMVVPEKYNQLVIERYNPQPDTLGGVIGTKYYFRDVQVRYPGGRYFTTYTFEQQFPVVNPLHAVIFLDAGNTWDLGKEIQPFNLKMGAGVGFRIDIPLLGNIGFDYAYGFDRDVKYRDASGNVVTVTRPRWVGHFLLGNVNN